ncbi:MAG: DUF2807 domain-containing protein [Myxococcota bacterium]
MENQPRLATSRRRRWALCALTTATLLGAGCFGTEGSGVEARKSYDFQEFERIKCDGLFDVHVKIGPEYSVTAIADDNILPMVNVSKFGDTLRVEANGSISNPIDPRVEIVLPQLRDVDLDGLCGGSISDLQGGELRVELEWMGDLELHGRLDTLHYDGRGDVKASHLKTDVAMVQMEGGKLILGPVTEKLEAHGSGKLRHEGTPKTLSLEPDIGPG